uniref:DUF1068 domain-containing protein n=1 Tax=Steinernema glaseri TaxID=37863 RepID=A0A1I8A5U6_9BILA
MYQRPEAICQRCVEAVSGEVVGDQLKLMKDAVEQARKLRRDRLIACLEREVLRLRDERNTSKNAAMCV